MSSSTDIFKPTDPTTPGFYPASRTALLLLDFHNLFVDKMGGSAAPAALEVAAQLRAWAHGQGIVVIHNPIDIGAPPTATCKDRERFIGIVSALAGTPGEEPDVLLRGWEEGKDVKFLKRPGHVSAMKSPGLEEFLRERGIVSLIVTGLSTTGCVLRTAFAASDAEFVVTVIADGCADPAEGAHDFSVKKLLNNRNYITTAAEFREGFERVAGKK